MFSPKNIDKKGLGHLFYTVTVLFFCFSCSNTKYLPAGEQLYVRGEVELNTDTIPQQYIKPLTEELEDLLRPKPNSQYLGMRPQLYIYNIIDSPRRESSLKGWLKYKVGEEPVYLSDVNREYNENLLRNRLENLGFFNAEVASDTSISKRKATVTYTATPGIVYRINSVIFETDSSDLGRAITGTQSQSLLQEGRPFSLSNIVSERERIDNDLKNQGYYYFNPDYLLVQVDSSNTEVDHHVDLYLTVKPETPARAKQRYKINNIVIFPNYDAGQTGVSSRIPRNAELYRGQFYFVDPEHTFRKFSLARTIFFNKGDYYNRRDHSNTLNQLVNMGTFQFVKNEFLEVDTGKGNLLDVHYYLTPLPKRGLRVELLGKMASVYNGSEINANWMNRNMFKSAELLTLSVYGGFETQTGGNVNLNSSFRRYGAEVNLSFPRIIAPFHWEPTRRFVPRSYIKLGYEYLNRRTAYSLNSMRLTTGYQWKEDIEKEHELAILDIAYVQPQNISDDYRAMMDTIPSLRHTVEPQFTFGPTYNFIYTNTMNAQLTHSVYFKGGLDLSANVYGMILGANYKKGEVYNVFNARFSQYIKLDGDFRHYYKLGLNTTLASRLMAGFGYSYGNSSALPYVKQFYSGGPNGLKAFRARAIGPGSHVPEYLGENRFLADQTGDIKLELNTELRAKLAGIMHGAIFVDAGNIWLQNADPDKPGAHFTKNFISELAVGTGVGLRFDLSFLIIRTDLAMPLRLPYRPKGNRWVFNEINFGDRAWRSNNLVFNLAIGYPF